MCRPRVRQNLRHRKRLRAWEASRRQEGVVTLGQATEHNQVWDEEGVDYAFDDESEMWTCCHCTKRYDERRDVVAHLTSGAHEVHRYFCSECRKKFKTMRALQSHWWSSGHSAVQQRLTSVRQNLQLYVAKHFNLSRLASNALQVARDDLRSSQLLIGNGPPPAEGKLMFDGSNNSAGWVL
jgi:hypothetical protein